MRATRSIAVAVPIGMSAAAAAKLLQLVAEVETARRRERRAKGDGHRIAARMATTAAELVLVRAACRRAALPEAK